MQIILYLLITTLLTAQAPTDTRFYQVSYVDIAPASRTAAIAAIKKFRETSRKSDGFERLEFFEQIGRPGHFCIVETWREPKSFEGNSATAKQFRGDLDSVRISDVDQRPYKTLSLGSATKEAGDKATFVITHVDIGGQGTNAADLLKKLADSSRKEEGNLRFDVLLHTMRANHFTVIEAWQNQKALDAHAVATHTKQYRDGLAPISGSPLDERLYKLIE